jgi:hypothetical protein
LLRAWLIAKVALKIISFADYALTGEGFKAVGVTKQINVDENRSCILGKHYYWVYDIVRVLHVFFAF